jgi:hypothetical protein
MASFHEQTYPFERSIPQEIYPIIQPGEDISPELYGM